MVFTLRIIFCLTFLLALCRVHGHGRLMDPVQRGSQWRKGYPTLPNYNDNQNFCGGFNVQYTKNKGMCGPCGDDYSLPRPRDNENGGKYGVGPIVQKYEQGQHIDIQVQITANHLGYFEFSVCELNSTMELETEECFDANRLYLNDGSTEYPVQAGKLGYVDVKAVLPAHLYCEHCVLRWHYHCGNNWGICPNGTGALGCGDQETFRGCADIAIL